jgi:hypothetical protein
MNAILKHREMFLKTNIDMHKDGITVSGLAQIILSRKMRFEPVHIPVYQPPQRIVTEAEIKKRIKFYAHQDSKKNRSPCTLTVAEAEQLLQRENGQCTYCHTILDSHNWSPDRINNQLPHESSNRIASCSECNRERDVPRLFISMKRSNLITQILYI